jgi:hypothetical protein
MSSKTSKKMYLLIVLILLLSMEMDTKADFVFGTPTNLGPTINTSALDITVNIAADGLSLFLTSDRPGGYGGWDIWVSTRTSVDDQWGEPQNLGSIVNSSAFDYTPSISADGLTLYFNSNRPGGFGENDIYVTTRITKDDPWGAPVNLGPPVNSSANDFFPSISSDSLSLYFSSGRSGGFGIDDIYVSTRASTDDLWGEPVNLGQTVNTSHNEGFPSISADGLLLFFSSFQDGGVGKDDLWVTMRATKDDDWGTPVNLGEAVNSPDGEGAPSISSDGSTIYFYSDRPGGFGLVDIWQVSIDPVVDLNSDGIVDAADLCIIVDNWGTDNSLCDIGPMPWGDGVVDVEDLIVLAEHLFEEVPPAEPIE